MNDPRGLPRILLVEDEPTSAAFLAAALRAIPAQVDVAPDMATALRMANQHAYGLWMFDATLPDGSGGELLGRLQQDFSDVPAIAHTASEDPTQLADLARRGFQEVLQKPLPGAAVQAAVRRVLGLPATSAPAPLDPMGGPVPVWDDRAAASALNGNDAHVATLRGLFIAELPSARERITAAARSRNFEAVAAELHRLRASCGFVGAAKLDTMVKALERDPANPVLMEHFDEAARETLMQPQAPGTRSSQTSR